MKKTICLNMIVKNESKVIKKCLASVKSIIDYWIIIDTGSTDGTQEIIREFMKDVPGELHEYPWVDFAHNRNQALALSKNKGDYLLFIDADEELIFHEPFNSCSLNKDCYFFFVQQPSGINYCREALVQSRLNWEWVGPVHETLKSSQAQTYEILENVVNFSSTLEGRRSQDPDKYLKDANLLEKALEKEPNNSRHIFYLALSYANAGLFEKAKYWHEKRIKIEESEQEVFYSLLSIAKLEENLKAGEATIVKAYTKAFLYRPSRAEPLFYLTNYYLKKKNYVLGYLFSKKGIGIPRNNDIIFVQDDVYDTGCLLQFADCSFAIGKFQETLSTYQKLLQKPSISPDLKKSLEKNLRSLQALMNQEKEKTQKPTPSYNN